MSSQEEPAGIAHIALPVIVALILFFLTFPFFMNGLVEAKPGQDTHLSKEIPVEIRPIDRVRDKLEEKVAATEVDPNKVGVGQIGADPITYKRDENGRIDVILRSQEDGTVVTSTKISIPDNLEVTIFNQEDGTGYTVSGYQPKD